MNSQTSEYNISLIGGYHAWARLTNFYRKLPEDRDSIHVYTENFRLCVLFLRHRSNDVKWLLFSSGQTAVKLSGAEAADRAQCAVKWLFCKRLFSISKLKPTAPVRRRISVEHLHACLSKRNNRTQSQTQYLA